jgi:hypothetical protein
MRGLLGKGRTVAGERDARDRIKESKPVKPQAPQPAAV